MSMTTESESPPSDSNRPSPGPGPTEPLSIRTADGFALKGFAWRHACAPGACPPVVIINAATSVRCQYYFRYADYLFANGFDVIVYDYRGIGESRPPSLRGFHASWSDWGALDFEAVLLHAAHAFPEQAIDVVGHSFGGCAIGLAASSHHIRRIVTVGAQFAYWRDYAQAQRWRMLAKWHLFMPLLTRGYGYFPGKRLKWLEDTPLGVVRDWSTSTPRLEDRPSGKKTWSAARRLPFDTVTAPILAISTTDDPFATIPATERLLRYFKASAKTHLRIRPQDIGVAAIGHFAFFHSRFQETLWPISLAWLQTGKLPAQASGTLIHAP